MIALSDLTLVFILNYELKFELINYLALTVAKFEKGKCNGFEIVNRKVIRRHLVI